MSHIISQLSEKEIIETLWYVFDLDNNQEIKQMNIKKHNAEKYIFVYVLPILELHGYRLMRSKKHLLFRNIMEDKLHTESNQDILLSTLPVKEWLRKGEHLPDIFKEFSDTGDFIHGIEIMNPEISLFMNRIPGHVFLIDYFLYYMGMCGFVVRKKAGKSNDYNDIILAHVKKREDFYELLLGNKKG